MLSEKHRRLLTQYFIAGNNTLICFALVDLIVIYVLVSKFVMPELFQPVYIVGAEDPASLYWRVVICAGIPNLLGVLAIFFGIKSLNEARKAARGKINLKDWTYWLYLVTVIFGVFAVVKTFAVLWLFMTA